MYQHRLDHPVRPDQRVYLLRPAQRIVLLLEAVPAVVPIAEVDPVEVRIAVEAAVVAEVDSPEAVAVVVVPVVAEVAEEVSADNQKGGPRDHLFDC